MSTKHRDRDGGDGALREETPAAAPASTATPPDSSTFRTGHVAVVGRTNAGKSTLVNHLVGEKVSIVSPVAQTTRNLVIGIRNEPGAQFVLVDTPGFHVPEHELNRRMIEEVRGGMAGVDVVILVIDASDRFGKGDMFALEQVRALGTPFVIALNKVDLVRPRERLLPLLERLGESEASALVPISATAGTNVAALLDEVRKLLPEGPAVYPKDITTDQTERFLAAELIREKILLATREEIPHASVVLVERVAEKTGRDGKPLLVVEAIIGVEKENQKAILIGRQGAMLGRIGSEARKDLEKDLGLHCHLALTVAVRKRWREDPAILDRVFSGTRGLVVADELRAGRDGAEEDE